jgi:hypothetical protein
MPSLARIDPWDIEQFVVFSMEKDFLLGRGLEKKFWASIGHYPNGHLFVFKTTASRVQWYKDQGDDRMRGVVLYGAGQLPCFPRETIIELDNGFEISYEEIRERQRERTFQIEQKLPDDFPIILRNRIDNSITLDGIQRAAIANALAHPRGSNPSRG